MNKNEITWGPLPREEVIKAVERKNPSRIRKVWVLTQKGYRRCDYYEQRDKKRMCDK